MPDMGKFDCEMIDNIWRKFEYANGPVWERVTMRELLDCCNQDELRTLRAIINGKLGKRTITPEQQAKMQLSRKRIIVKEP